MRTLACLLMVVGCGGGGGGGSTDVQPTLSFKDRTDAELSQLISAAGGTDMFFAQGQVDQFSDGSDACPAVTVSGDTVTLTGGCTTADGMMIGGSATVTNPTTWDQVQYNYQEPTDYELSAFSVTSSAQAMMFDGRITISGSFTVYDADVTSTLTGTSIRSDIHYQCNQGTQTCDLSGSGIELVGVGGALVSGSVKILQADETSTFTLKGTDTLKATVTNACVAYTISDSSMAKTCP